MIDVAAEQLVPIRDVPCFLPPRSNGRGVHLSAVYRWLSRGIRGIQLESVKIGGTTYTSIEAVQRFADRLSTRGVPSADESETPRKLVRQKQIDRAAAEIEQILGVRRSPR